VALDGLRDAADGDAWSLIALIGACWAEYPGCIVDIAGEYPELLAPASHYRRRGGALWVLPEGAWVAACVGVCPGQQQPMELVKLYVAPHRRGRGLGQELVAWAEERASALGATGIELWSDTRFLDAHRLYRRLGYTQTGATRALGDLSQTTEYAFEKRLMTPSVKLGADLRPIAPPLPN
jgi:GNAT superfamily N-acetyltransferase